MASGGNHPRDSSDFSGMSSVSDDEVHDLDVEAPSDLLFSSPEPTPVTLDVMKEFGPFPKGATALAGSASHEVQLLKMEVSQKTMALANQKAEFQSKEEKYKESISGLQHHVQLLQHKLEADLHLQQAHAQQMQSKLRQELDEAVARHRQLEERNEHLLSQATQLKRLFQGDLELSEEQYEHLRSRRGDSDIGVRDFVMCRLYEAMLPLRKEVADMRRHITVIEEERDRTLQETDSVSALLEHERQVHATLQRDYQKVLAELHDVKNKVQSGNYKIEHFDRVQSERNKFESTNQSLREQLQALEADHGQLARDNDDVLNQMAECKQTVSLLQQDKDYLTRQVTELSHRCTTAEERLAMAQRNLDDVKQAREELYEKYVRSRDECKTQYENQLKDEVDKLRMKTDHELERLKVGQRDLFERENLSLREQRDAAMEAQEKAVEHARDLETRLDRLRQEMVALQTTQDNRISELLAQCKVRAFEAQRSGLLYEESKTQMEHAVEESDKLRSKLEVLTKEYYQMESSLGKRISNLDQQLGDCQRRLQVYEKLEDELDSAVMQAAELADSRDPHGESIDAERILFSYAGGAGAQLPSQAKRRMQQSVELARRILQLERRCAELKKQNDEWEVRHQESADELGRVNQILQDAQQPYGYLIESLRSRDASLQKQQALIQDLKSKLEASKKERATMAKVKNQMAADLERLLAQREELFMLKQLFSSMKQNGMVATGNSRKSNKSGGQFPGFETEVATSGKRSGPKSSLSPRQERPYGISYT